MIYPSLPALRDFGILRLSGAGLGNCLFVYFHAVVLGKTSGQAVIAPTWSSVKIGPLLRGERSMRRYGTMLRAHDEEIAGLRKVVSLATLWPLWGHTVGMAPGRPPKVTGKFTTVAALADYTFAGLHPHRAMLRQRLLDIMIRPPRRAPRWGAADYIAVHVRLGDFKPVDANDERLKSGKINGLRVPLTWYVNVIRRVREVFPRTPVRIFSDGHETELAELLAIEGVILQRGSNDIDDLLALSEAKLLVASNTSTYSHWAIFFGNMPSIWLKTATAPEQPSDPRVPLLLIDQDTAVITSALVVTA